MRILLITSKEYDFVNDKLFTRIISSIEGASLDHFENVLLDNIDQIDTTKYNAVLAIGSEPVKYFTNTTPMKAKESYEVKFADENTLTVIPLASTSYIKHNPEYLITFAENISKAYYSKINIKEKPTKYKVVTNLYDLNVLLDNIKKAGWGSFDFETSSLEVYTDFNFYVRSLAISFQHGSAWVIPFYENKDVPNKLLEVDIPLIIKKLEDEYFNNSDIIKIGQNVKYDMHCATQLGVASFDGRIEDTMVMHHLIDENNGSGLKDMVARYMFEYAGYENKIDKNFISSDFNTLAEYNAVDADLTGRLHTYFTQILLEDDKLYRLHRNFNNTTLKVLFDIEKNGILVNREFLDAVIADTDNIIDEIRNEILSLPKVKKFIKVNSKEMIVQAIQDNMKRIVTEREDKNREYLINRYKNKIAEIKSGALVIKYEFNIGSPKQVGEFIYTDKGLNKPLFVDKDGEEKKATGENVLKSIDDDSGFIDKLLAYRKVIKIQSTYLKPIYEKSIVYDNVENPNVGIIHTNYKQIGTKTGRISSANPNMQNIPRGSIFPHDGVKKVVSYVKKSFIPPKDWVFVQVDYSQAELRLAAHFANEKTMINAYNNNQDLHTLTVLNVMDISEQEYRSMPKDVQKQYRVNGKVFNFGLIYGLSAFGLAQYAKSTFNIDMSMNEAQTYHAKFFELYSALPLWHKMSVKEVKDKGYTRTLFGRKRNLYDVVTSDVDYIKKQGENQAINSRVQGTAGEFTLFAMAITENRIDKRYVRSCNTVHDSGMYYIHPDHLNEQLKIIVNTWENLPYVKYFNCEELKVGMKVDVEISKENWGMLSEYSKENFMK